jgi:hypothetical protein
LLFRFPPATSAFYWTCPIHSVTGYLCPGCGGTRALAALLHGDVANAIRWNAMLVVLLPPAAAYTAVAYARAAAGRQHPWPPLPNGVMWTLLAGVCIFTLLRNIP